MDELNEQTAQQQLVQENETKETYQKLETKVVDVKVEKGYASSEGPLVVPQWQEGSW